MALAAILPWVPTGTAQAASVCESCEVQLGIGGTYHYWGPTGGVVVPLLVNWSDARYEIGIFRLSTSQALHEPGTNYSRLLAQPYWGASISRR